MPSRDSPEPTLDDATRAAPRANVVLRAWADCSLANSIFSMAKRFRSTARALDLRREPLFHPQALRFLHIGIF